MRVSNRSAHRQHHATPCKFNGTHGALTAPGVQEEYVLEHMAEVFSCLRSCNVALRWLLLHTAASHRKLRAAVASAAPAPNALLTLLLDTALLEYEVRPYMEAATPSIHMKA